MGAKQPDDQYTEEEAQRRFLATVKAALNTPPKPLKELPRKRPKKQRPRKAKSSLTKDR
jgi:hypothetical protein